MKNVVIFLWFLFAPLLLNAQAAQVPKIPCDFVGYEAWEGALKTGDTVSAEDAQKNELGSFFVDVEGRFGFLRISADDSETPEKEGAQEGETLFFYINGIEQETTAVWMGGGLVEVDLGIPKIPLTIEITSPEDGSAVSENPITITGEVNNPQAQIEISLNEIVWTPAVNSDGTFSQGDINLEEGANIISVSVQDAAHNTADTQISLYLGWVLHLKDVPWYEKEQSHYSGAAASKMILDYLREENQAAGKTQDEIYNYGHPLT